MVGLGVLALASGGGSEDAAGEPTPPGLLACTGEDEITNFPVYSVGPEFEGLPLTDVDRECTQPHPGGPPQARLNMVSYTYGECEPPPGEGGCPLPLEVQTWPRCEREPNDYEVGHHNPLKAKLTLRGVPAHLYEDGLRLEVLTGRSTVVVFGLDRAQVLRAARALVKAPARPRDHPPSHGDASRRLPSPPGGPIACD